MWIGRRIRILIVEDDPGVYPCFQRALSTASWEPVVATSGAEAIDKATREQYDCALIDFHFGDMDVVEVLRKMRETQPDLTAILISGYIPPDQIERIRGIGFNAIAQKPITIADLKDLVADTLDDHARGVKSTVISQSRSSIGCHL